MKAPIATRVSLLKTLALLGAFAIVTFALDVFFKFLPGSFVYTFLILYLIRRHHYNTFSKGLVELKHDNLVKGLKYFEDYLIYLKQNPYVDRFGTILAFNVSEFSLTEMTLMNIAYCHSQTGNIEKAVSLYKTIFETNPNNGFALAAIRAFENRPIVQQVTHP